MEKLVGNWMGFFEDGSGYRVSFLAAIENIAYGTFIGRAKDNIIEKDDEYTSVIGGKLNDDDVVFRKSYTSIDADVVFYYGKLNERKITGTWYTQKDTLSFLVMKISFKSITATIAGGVFVLASCAKTLRPTPERRTEDDFVYVCDCQTYLYKDFVKKLNKRPSDTLLLRYHQHFRDSCGTTFTRINQ
jgi:hypothetical protein